MIGPYIIGRNRHANDERLRAVIDRANVASFGTSYAKGGPRLAKVRGRPCPPILNRPVEVSSMTDPTDIRRVRGLRPRALGVIA
jgi:hypothetical protein